MRLPFIPPAGLSPEQRPLYEDMRAGIGESFHGFAAVRADGALMGPWNPWLHEARIGKPVWDLVKALSVQSQVPDAARQVAILVTGAHFRAGYEIYAHVASPNTTDLLMPSLPRSSRGSVPRTSPATRLSPMTSPPRSQAEGCHRS